MARSVLTARLRKLTEQGILERREYSHHPPRHEYLLTDKGLALFPVIAALMEWGDTWAPNPAGPPTVFVHDTCGNITRPVLTCPHCHGDVTTANTQRARPRCLRAARDGGQLPPRCVTLRYREGGRKPKHPGAGYRPVPGAARAWPRAAARVLAQL